MGDRNIDRQSMVVRITQTRSRRVDKKDIELIGQLDM